MKAKDIAYISICTALIAVCAWISINIPAMPFTLQVLGVAFAAYFLGIKKCSFAVGAYLLIGAVGVPVFNGFTAGFGSIIGPTGGFLIGFIPMAIIMALFSYIGKDKLVFQVIGAVVGHVTLYIIGNIWLTVLTMGENSFFDRLWAVIVMMLPYYAIDIIKIVAALFLARFLKKVLKYE